MIDFTYDLDEIVAIGGRTISLRQALREYIDARKRSGGVLMGPMWFRDGDETPGVFNVAHMETLAAAIPAEDLNASND